MIGIVLDRECRGGFWWGIRGEGRCDIQGAETREKIVTLGGARGLPGGLPLTTRLAGGTTLVEYWLQLDEVLWYY